MRLTSVGRVRKSAGNMIGGVGILLAAVLGAPQAEAREIYFKCAPGDTSPEIGRLVVEIPEVGLDARFAEPREGAYEMAFFGDLHLRDQDPNRPRWLGRPRCRQSFDWQETWAEPRRFYRTPVGAMSQHRAGIRIVIDNVPRDVLVQFRLGGSEQDRSGQDFIGFAPGETGGRLELQVAPRDRHARVIAGGAARQTLRFGQSGRVYGGRRHGAGYNGAADVVLRYQNVRRNPAYSGYPPVVEPEPVHNPALKRGCRKYAREAVGLFEEAQALGCGLHGREWSGDAGGHFDWCMQVGNLDAARTRNAGRRGAIKACRGQAGGGSTGHAAGSTIPDEATCQSYAVTAADSARKAASFECGFSGDRWATDTQTHYRWCMGAARLDDLQAERVARGEKLHICMLDQQSGGK
ncbi:hypothetical protein [Roseovarius pelagicus]|uniref:Uncharacterized protein n=1 Tax=Roseovarius pelagicus TaxID=2980108 RepID=A0ABY6DBE4_9RHOB|nr:hypothetical protein [Roseovarius pelagicus]UXX83425.1 hypothetical protein N7U68_01700 [Roseovarius pelagicus]